MAGDSSVSLYPREQVTYFGDECSKDDSMYRDKCSLLIRRHLQNLHSLERAADAPPRFSFFETLKDSYYGWFQLWEDETHIFDSSSDEAKRKLQLYGALGAAMLQTYWRQNADLKDPLFVYGPGDPRTFSHPHGGEPIKQYVSQIREVGLRWIQFVRRDLLRNGRLVDRYDPVVLVIFTTDFWEETPQVFVRRDFGHVVYDNSPVLNSRGYRGKVAMAYRRKEDACVRSLWLYKKLHGHWPIAVVFYQLMSGICFPCWTKRVPKVAKQSDLKPFEAKSKKKKKGDDQFNLAFIQPSHPHPFEKTKVTWANPHKKVPWVDLKRT